LKRLVLLGAGPAHLATLLQWTRDAFTTAEVTLVAPLEKQAFPAMVPGHLAGQFQAEELMLPVAELAQAAKVRWLVGSAAHLDAAQRTVTLADGRAIAYDALSIDTSGVQGRDAMPGAREHALWVRPVEPYLNFITQVFEISRERELDVVVVGGGATGVEMALAIQCRFDSLRAAHGRSRVSLVAGRQGVLPRYGEAARRAALRALAKAKVVVVQEEAHTISSDHVHLRNGARLACDAAIMCTGIEPPAWLKPSGLGLTPAGFVATGPTFQSVSHANVFATGELARQPDAPIERSAGDAGRISKPLADNLRAFVAGGELVSPAASTWEVSFLTLGKRSAFASWGPYSARGAAVWWFKRRRDKTYVQACLNGLKPTP
jgi:NADH dehydrogenase FAD-containing subunit